MFRGELVRVGRPVLYQLQRNGQVRLSSTSYSIASLLYPNSSSPKVAQNENITVNGFVRSVRKQKNIAFVALGDGTTSKSLQIVLSPDLASGYVSMRSLAANIHS
jgi:asparaginyl-tRNA synthetase